MVCWSRYWKKKITLCWYFRYARFRHLNILLYIKKYIYIDLAKHKSRAPNFWLLLIICENTWTCDHVKIHNLASCQLKKKNVTSMNWAHSNVILVKGCLVLTAVIWPWDGSRKSNCRGVSCMHRLTSMSAMLCDVVVVIRTRPRAICRWSWLTLVLRYGAPFWINVCFWKLTTYPSPGPTFCPSKK